MSTIALLTRDSIIATRSTIDIGTPLTSYFISLFEISLPIHIYWLIYLQIQIWNMMYLSFPFLFRAQIKASYIHNDLCRLSPGCFNNLEFSTVIILGLPTVRCRIHGTATYNIVSFIENSLPIAYPVLSLCSYWKISINSSLVIFLPVRNSLSLSLILLPLSELQSEAIRIVSS